MLVLFWVSMKTGSMCTTIVLLAAIGLLVSFGKFSCKKIVIPLSFGTSGRGFELSRLGTTRCSNFFTPSAHTRTVQAVPKLPVHRPQAAHHCKGMSPPTIV